MSDEDSLLVRWRRDPVTLFVLGLTALVLCQAASPVVWWAARTEQERREQASLALDPFLGASRILGLLGTVLLKLNRP